MSLGPYQSLLFKDVVSHANAGHIDHLAVKADSTVFLCDGPTVCPHNLFSVRHFGRRRSKGGIRDHELSGMDALFTVETDSSRN